MTDLIRILIAPLVWLAAFSAIYGLHGVLCGQGVSGEILGLSLPRVLLVVGYGAAILVQLALLWVLYERRFASASAFVTSVSRLTGWVGLVATIWSLFPVMVTTSCA